MVNPLYDAAMEKFDNSKELMGVKKEPERPSLTGKDYMTIAPEFLVENRGFSQHAYRIIQAISKMTTEEIEQLNLNPSGRKR